jgi:site-specific DNA-cytosine methylase
MLLQAVRHALAGLYGQVQQIAGPDSAAHEHTRAFMKYAGRVAPKVIVFECVQQAYTQGRDVMNKYRLMVEEISGKKYDLYHVKQNNLQLGGFSYRPRYFWVAVRKGLKFGAQVIEPKEMPKIMDIIGDLAKLPQQWEEQKYIEKHSKFTKTLRSQNRQGKRSHRKEHYSCSTNSRGV